MTPSVVNLPEELVFDWDQGNLNKNRLKHNVTWEECEEIFYNEPLLVNPDIKHSQQEVRYKVLGQTNLGRGLLLAFTFRNDKIRVISARDQSRKETNVYQQLSIAKIHQE